jgi:hypothetical protein
MRRHRIIASLGLVTMIAGCAAPGARINSSPSSEEGSALPAARELNGTWHGSYSQLGMALYEDAADCTLRITEGATFAAKCTRSPLGTNNLAKPSSWSGRVVTKGDRVILEDRDGQWPSIVLSRSKNDQLYAVTLDPLVGATVEMDFEYVPTRAASGVD